MCDQRVGTVIVRRPGPRLCEGLVTFQERESVSFETAVVQWTAYVDTFRLHGWKVVEVEPADDCPDAVFIEVWSRTFQHNVVC
jgi:dimethylargininase